MLLCVREGERRNCAVTVAVRAALGVEGACALTAGTGGHGHHDAAVLLDMRGATKEYIKHALTMAMRTCLLLVIRTLCVIEGVCAYLSTAVAFLANNFLLNTEVLHAALNTVQERQGDVHRDVRATVIGLTAIASEASEASEASSFAEDVREVTKNFVHIHIALIACRIILYTHVAELVVTSTLLIIL